MWDGMDSFARVVFWFYITSMGGLYVMIGEFYGGSGHYIFGVLEILMI